MFWTEVSTTELSADLLLHTEVPIEEDTTANMSPLDKTIIVRSRNASVKLRVPGRNVSSRDFRAQIRAYEYFYNVQVSTSLNL